MLKDIYAAANEGITKIWQNYQFFKTFSKRHFVDQNRCSNVLVFKLDFSSALKIENANLLVAKLDILLADL